MIKILAPSLLCLATICQVLLDYYWRDHQTRLYKIIRILILCIIVASLPFTLYGIVSGDKESADLKKEVSGLNIALEKSKKAAEAREEAAALERKALQDKLAEMFKLLEPFAVYADKNYQAKCQEMGSGLNS